MTVRRVTGRLAAALACALVAPPPVLAAAAAVPSCTAFAAAPDGRTLWCAGHERDETGHPRAIRVYRSADGGRGWHVAGRVAPASPHEAESLLVAVAVSPAYASDRRLLLQTTRALYVSTDSGASFTLLDQLGGGQYADALAPLVHGATGRVLAYNATPTYDNAVASVTDVATGAHLPVPAAGVVRFLPVGDELHAIRLDNGTVSAWDCAMVACTSARHTFAGASGYLGGGPVGDGTAYVVLRAGGSARVWRGGRSGYTSWPSLSRLLPPLGKPAERAPTLRVVASPGAPRTLYAFVGHHGSSGTVPAHRLFRSTDGGASWGLVASGRSRRQGGAAGLPWNAPTRGVTGAEWSIVALPGSRLVVLAGVETAPGRYGYEGPFCSPDGGRRWSRAC